MPSDEEFETELALQDDAAFEALAPFFDARPARAAWRSDPDAAPTGKPVYVREADSIRVLIGVRDEEGWARSAVTARCVLWIPWLRGRRLPPLSHDGAARGVSG